MNPARIILILAVMSAVSASTSAQYKHYENGFDSYNAGRFAEAIGHFNEYLARPSRDKTLDVEVHYLRALSNYKTQDFKSAMEDFGKALDLKHPNKGNIYWFIAKCSDQLGFYPDAADAYENAISELGSDKKTLVTLLHERSRIYIKLDNKQLAYRDLKKAFDIQPGNSDIKSELEKLEQEDWVAAAKPDMDVSRAVASASPTTELAEIYKDEKRYALVIGNSRYSKEVGQLRNPVNDAIDMAAELERSRFEVQLVTDATYGQMRAAFMKFKEKIDKADREKTVALFYFAGHGIRMEDENYLVPIDASIEYQDDVWRYCFPVQKMVLNNMEAANSRMNIVILDACRNNPFPSLTRTVVNQGLGEMKKARGAFIAYATAPGSVAIDGTGRNGLYTQELLKAMRLPGLTIEQLFKEVRLNVYRLSGEKQNTWDSSNITGEFYFKF